MLPSCWPCTCRSLVVKSNAPGSHRHKFDSAGRPVVDEFFSMVLNSVLFPLKIFIEDTFTL